MDNGLIQLYKKQVVLKLLVCLSVIISIIGKINQKGLNMIDIEGYFRALKSSWVKQICQADATAQWSYLPLWYIKELHICEVIQNIILKNSHKLKLLKISHNSIMNGKLCNL